MTVRSFRLFPFLICGLLLIVSVNGFPSHAAQLDDQPTPLPSETSTSIPSSTVPQPPTDIATEVPTETATETSIPSEPTTASPTDTSIATDTATASATSTASATRTATRTRTATPTRTSTRTPSITRTPSVTRTPSATRTATISGTPPPTATPPAGTEFLVTTTSDTRDSVVGDGVCSDEQGLCSLRAAVQEANALYGYDTITIPAGTYLFTLAGNENASLAGDLDITDSVHLVGDGATNTIVDGNQLDRIFTVNARVHVTLSQFTIQGGVGAPSGGGILAVLDSQVSMTDMVVRNNAVVDNGTSAEGGGIASNGRLLIVNSTISGNTANGPRASGGGIYSTAPLTLINSAVTSNTVYLQTTSNGGGITTSTSRSVAKIVNSTISGNYAHVGGGIYGTSDAYVYNSSIVSNTAGLDGGGIALRSINSRMGTLQLGNSIVASNTDANADSPDCSGSIASLGYNLIEHTNGCTITGDTSSVLEGIDPLIGPLNNNGGSTNTHALRFNSPAIDGGNPGGCVDYSNMLLSDDQRAVMRPQDGNGDATARCDIGAYEYVYTTP